MTVLDLDAFSKPLKMKKFDYVDIHDLLYNDDNLPDLVVPANIQNCFPYVSSFISGDINIINDLIVRNSLVACGKKEYEAPYDLQMMLYIWKTKAYDYKQFPSFYSQTVLDSIKFYTEVTSDGYEDTGYTFESLASEIFETKLDFLSSINLCTKDMSDRKLGEIYIDGAGVCIMPADFIRTKNMRESILSLHFDGTNLNEKIDRRMLPGRYSILDWRQFSDFKDMSIAQ